MISISVCMIVKNEEKILARCLDSLKGIADEMVIVDTGSTDRTKEIAQTYTDKIYDFEWIDDFSAARNYAFSKATKEYVYMADADEVIDEENRRRFLLLKEMLSSEVEIVQMYYDNQLDKGTVYNFNKEYRPKLYKRVRQFRFEDPIHEAVRLDPVIYNSEIAILHLPQECHAKRDFGSYYKAIERGETISPKLFGMFAKELWIAGDDDDFRKAQKYFKDRVNQEVLDETSLKSAQCVLAHCAAINEDNENFFMYCLHNVADGKASAEICYELGCYYMKQKWYAEASMWFYNAAYEAESQCNIHYSGDYALYKLAECLRQLGDEETAQKVEDEAEEWVVPDSPDVRGC